MDNEISTLKESIDVLIDENERLRKRIEVLEANKRSDEGTFNTLEESIENALEKVLQKPFQGKPYKTYFDEDNNIDWSYHPKRQTYNPPDYWWPGAPFWWGTIPPYYNGPRDCYGNPLPYCNTTANNNSGE